MRRIVGIIVHNWPLKLAAIGLATLMYGGLALSQNTQSFTGGVPVRVINQPPDTVLLAAPEPVKTVRYFAPNGVPVAASSFVATVDLEGVVPKDGLATAPIQVVAVDTRIRILGYDPQVASIPLEPLKTKEVDVRVESPLHDGAVIIRDERIVAAGALLPLAETSIHTERFGTRHRAALGITEQTDAVVVVVSEENGQISLVERARIVRNLTEAGLARAISGLLDPAGGRRGAFGWRSAAQRRGTEGRSPRLRELGRLVGRPPGSGDSQATAVAATSATSATAPSASAGSAAGGGPAVSQAVPAASAGAAAPAGSPPSPATDDDVVSSVAARAPR